MIYLDDVLSYFCTLQYCQLITYAIFTGSTSHEYSGFFTGITKIFSIFTDHIFYQKRIQFHGVCCYSPWAVQRHFPFSWVLLPQEYSVSWDLQRYLSFLQVLDKSWGEEHVPQKLCMGQFHANEPAHVLAWAFHVISQTLTTVMAWMNSL